MEQKKKRTERTVISATRAQQECSHKQRMNDRNIKTALRYAAGGLSEGTIEWALAKFCGVVDDRSFA